MKGKYLCRKKEFRIPLPGEHGGAGGVLIREPPPRGSVRLPVVGGGGDCRDHHHLRGAGLPLRLQPHHLHSSLLALASTGMCSEIVF